VVIFGLGNLTLSTVDQAQVAEGGGRGLLRACYLAGVQRLAVVTLSFP